MSGTETLTNKTFGNATVISDNSSSSALRITQTGSGNALVVEDSANPDSTPFVVTADGNVAVGVTSTANALHLRRTGALNTVLQMDAEAGVNYLVQSKYSSDSGGNNFQFRKYRGSIGAAAVVQNGDVLGSFDSFGYDGTNIVYATQISSVVDGTPGTNDMPGRLVFSTTADGASSPTERMRIDSAGTVTFRNDYIETPVTANTGTAYTINIANGTVQILTLTGNCTFTFPTATAGKSFIMILKQDGTGSRTVTWPSAVKWPAGTAPTITSTASKADKYVFTADGTNWLGSVGGLNYTV